MKRILAVILLASMLLSMVACGAQSAENKTAEETKTEEKKTENKKEDEKKTEEVKTEEKKEVVYAKVNDPLTWDKINAIPVANASMSTDELRQICVDFIALQVSFPWVPKKSISYKVDRQGADVNFEEGGLYGGIPYVNYASGNVYRIMRYYDTETGHLDISLLETNKEAFGTACSGSACWAWARVVNSAWLTWTNLMVPANGFIPVGPYATFTSGETHYGAVSDSGIINPEPKEIAQKNGPQIMYESYALMKKADGLVSNGHVTMCSQEPIVVRNADGTINGKESYLLWNEQVLYTSRDTHKMVQSDGTEYRTQGAVNHKVSFKELYDSGYLPFTFAEFLGTDPVEPSKTEFLSETGDAITRNDLSLIELQKASLRCNYAMSDIHTMVKDAQGNVVLNYAKPSENHYVKEWAIVSALPASVLTSFAQKGGHTIEISVQLSTGEKPVFYTGALVG